MRQFSPKKKVSRFSRKYGNIEQLWNFGNRKFRNLLIDFLNLFQNLWGLNVMCIHLWLPWVLLDLELVTVTSSLDNRASRSPQWLDSDFIPRPNKILGFWKILLPGDLVSKLGPWLKFCVAYAMCGLRYPQNYPRYSNRTAIMFFRNSKILPFLGINCESSQFFQIIWLNISKRLC